MTDSALLTVEQAAAYLSLSRDYTYKLIERGDLASVKIGRARRVTRAALDEFIADHTQPTRRTRRRVA